MGLLIGSNIPKAGGFNYTQTTASASWVVVHNLNQANGPVVDVMIDQNGSLKKIIPLDITIDNANQVTVSFTSPQTGAVRCV